MRIEQMTSAFHRPNCLAGKSARYFRWRVRCDGPVIFHQRRKIRNRDALKNALSLSTIFDYVDVRIGENAEVRNPKNNWIVRITSSTSVTIRRRCERRLAARTAIFNILHRHAPTMISFAARNQSGSIRFASHARRHAMRDRRGPPASQTFEKVLVAGSNKHRLVVSSNDYLLVLLSPVGCCTLRESARARHRKSRG